MTYQPQQTFPPETILAARLLSYIPRTAEIPEQELKEAINGNDPYEQNLYKYAIQLLIEEGYVKKHPGVGIGNSSTRFSLTNAGRAICDNGGYLRAIKQKEKKEEFKDKVYQAEGKKKIFDHNVKIFIFIIAIIGGIVGILNILEKVMTPAPKQIVTSVPKDSVVATPPPQVTATTKPKHLSNKPAPKTVPTQTQPEEVVAATPVQAPPSSNSNHPIQSTFSDNIEFKLLKAVGNAHAQTITITMTLTTTAANWYINSSVRSIIDPEGNEYKLKSYTLGATNYGSSIDLTTNVPIRCTYTFGGVLPDVKSIKLFDYKYTHSWGEPFSVEFRDVPVEWR